jgi:sugar phosphate permease
LSIAAVAIVTQFNRSPAAMGVLLSAFYWSYALLQIPAGYLDDRRATGFQPVTAQGQDLP